MCITEADINYYYMYCMVYTLVFFYVLNKKKTNEHSIMYPMYYRSFIHSRLEFMKMHAL